MSKKLKSRLFICLMVTFGALFFLAPTIMNLMNPDAEDTLKKKSWLPDTAMRLGLDLKGGLHMVLGVDLEGVLDNQMQSYRNSLETSLESEGLTGAKVRVDKKAQELLIDYSSASDLEEGNDYIGRQYQGVFDSVGKLNNSAVFKINRTQEEFLKNRARDQTVETIRNRIDEFGIAEPNIAKKGDSQIVVEFPGAKDPERVKSLIGQTAKLDFHLVHECTDKEPACLNAQRVDLEGKITTAETAGNYSKDSFKSFAKYKEKLNEDLVGKIPENTFVAFEKMRDLNVLDKFNYTPYLLSNKDMLSGEFIEDAFVSQDSSGIGMARPVVSFRMDSAGAPKLRKLTSENTSRFMAIVLDGVVKSAPAIQSTISDSGQITLGSGNVDETNQEARDLSLVLRAGAMPATVEVQEERVVGPSIGRDAIEAGKKALIFACLFVLLFMWLYYGKAGLVSVFVTIINVSIIFAILGSLNATLTLPGIAGVVLTVGMVVDAMIIIFERMREEIRAGRNVRQAIEFGFDKAFYTILDSNITTMIGAFFLLYYGTGTIRGFAFTLIVGIATNVFMSTFFMKTFFQLFFNKSKNLSIGLSGRELKKLTV